MTKTKSTHTLELKAEEVYCEDCSAVRVGSMASGLSYDAVRLCNRHATTSELLRLLKRAEAEIGRSENHNCYNLCDEIHVAIIKADGGK